MNHTAKQYQKLHLIGTRGNTASVTCNATLNTKLEGAKSFQRKIYVIKVRSSEVHFTNKSIFVAAKFVLIV